MTSGSIDFDLRLDLPGGFSLAVGGAIATGRTTAVFGPSGAGKSTLLRVVAGLVGDVRGRLVVAGQTWLDERTRVPAHRRRVGYVPQDAVLFPHLTVEGNLAFAARRRAHDDGASLSTIVEQFDLSALLHRQTATLSGGERQRVAIARAMLSAPRLLLLDEPVSALDIEARDALLPFIERAARSTELGALYVSHALDEVVRLADDVLLMDGGRIEDSGPATEILGLHRAGRFSERAGAVLDATVERIDDEWSLAVLRVGAQSLTIPADGFATGESVRLRVPARDVALSRQPPGDTSVMNALVLRIDDIGVDPDPAMSMVALSGDGVQLLAQVTRRSCHELQLAVGDAVHALIKTAALARAR